MDRFFIILHIVIITIVVLGYSFPVTIIAVPIIPFFFVIIKVRIIGVCVRAMLRVKEMELYVYDI